MIVVLGRIELIGEFICREEEEEEDSKRRRRGEVWLGWRGSTGRGGIVAFF
jgi:hypothetical protein